MEKENVQAPAQFFTSEVPAFITAFMIAAVWFIIDSTCGLVLRARKGRISISRRRRRDGKAHTNSYRPTHSLPA